MQKQREACSWKVKQHLLYCIFPPNDKSLKLFSNFYINSFSFLLDCVEICFKAEAKHFISRSSKISELIAVIPVECFKFWFFYVNGAFNAL